jgi:predicted amidohydrolase
VTDKSTAPVSIAVGQMHCVPGDVAANLTRIETIVKAAAAEGAKLIVLPETATSGYFIADRLSALAEPVDGPTARALGALARSCRIHLAVGAPIADHGSFFDAQLLFGPDGGLLAQYRKAHLFAAERQWFKAGDTPVVVETELGRIGMTVCYDLIFPAYVARLAELGAELVINSTNWITDDWQRQAWGWSGPVVQALAATRALENGIWLAMADAVGPEGGFDSLGHSCIAAPSGRIVASLGEAQGFALAQIVHSSPDLDRWRAIATYRADRRPELYR